MHLDEFSGPRQPKPVAWDVNDFWMSIADFENLLFMCWRNAAPGIGE